MQGSKYTDKDRDAVKIMLLEGKEVSEIAKATGMPTQTIYTWRNDLKTDENFIRLGQLKKEQFEEQATRIIDKASTLLEHKIDRAIDDENVLDGLIKDYVLATEDDEDISKDASRDMVKKLAQKLSNLRIDDLNKLVTTVGVMYDKRALSKGDATENQNLVIKVEVK